MIEEFDKHLLKKDHDRDKGVANRMICGGRPTPEKKATPIILLEKDYYSRKKTQQIYLQLLKGKEPAGRKIGSFSELQSKEKASTSIKEGECQC